MKLKTLRDIIDSSKEGEIVEPFQIRDEAIKWIKNWKEIDAEAMSQSIFSFMSFFNILEEDLK